MPYLFKGAFMTYRKLFAPGLSLALVIPPVFSQDKSATLSKADSTAMTALAQADMAEIEAGKVATEKASSPDVKKFAEQMVKDHSMMLDEGKKLAQSKGAT